ncbi:MAG: TraR/DksA family transcriptional regulator [Ferrovum sp.]|jgi:phage/conjugal plasmid C-4 type zinc finger TraR family protein|uniref:TraR/DksA C4-type zinc finger protein n=1 Tax=Ferrovum sp. TaxID=2609467 RepID=UPI002603A564|nr:TraR/DksA C4-type zinc finger protein [Ferrovum sp.]MBW8068257.1 TraR/DksA family transcriptional regulator [Ferrovum sp.]
MDEADQAQIRIEKEDALTMVKARAPKKAQTKNCMDCGERITEKRRQFVPWATRCMPCQVEHEKERF